MTRVEIFGGCKGLKRRWIRIDLTYPAINLVQRGPRDHHPSDLSPYEIIGGPTDVQGAEALKEISPHQFEWWAVDLVNARPAKDRKKARTRMRQGVAHNHRASRCGAAGFGARPRRQGAALQTRPKAS